jgi:stearoyl-CoA desaturase (delta-9 desaturase)
LNSLPSGSVAPILPSARLRAFYNFLHGNANKLPFIAIHALCIAVFFVPATWTALGLCAGLYFVRMFALTAGYHRYFSHRAYKTSRWFQFVLAWFGCTAMQKGPLWWCAKHRNHHKYSDTDADPHSPVRHGLFWSHVGWVLFESHKTPDREIVKDIARYPELRLLERLHWLPGFCLLGLCYLIDGWSGVVWGFLVSTVLLYHGTFLVNSLCHIVGRRRFATTDDSRNNALVALLTLGEGWHNNHHHYMSSANQGFRWWEIDVSYYLLCLLRLCRIVWDLRKPPANVLAATA